MKYLDTNDRYRMTGRRPRFEDSVPYEPDPDASWQGESRGTAPAPTGDAPTLADIERDGAYTERRWIVEPVFPVGHASVLFAGPKVGKTTWLVAILVDLLLGRLPCGGALVGDAGTLPGDFEVLYLTEDGPQLLQLVRRSAGRGAHLTLSRIRTISPSRAGQLRAFDDVIAEVRAILAEHPRIRIVVTDTLGAWSRSTEMGSTYDYARMTGEVVAWAGLAAEFSVAGCLVHHANRQGGFLGSQAIAGCSAVNIALTRPREAERRVRLSWAGRSDDALHHQLLAEAGLLDHPEAERIEEGRRATVLHLEPYAFDDPEHGICRSYRQVEASAAAMTEAEKAEVRRALDARAVISCLQEHPGDAMGVGKLVPALADGAWRRACLDDGMLTVPEWYWDEGSPGKSRLERATKAIRDDREAYPDRLTEHNRALAWKPE